MCSATSDVRFTPDNDRESGLSQVGMSALPPKADMCSALADARFGPKADIAANTEVSHGNLIDDLVDLGEKRW